MRYFRALIVVLLIAVLLGARAARFLVIDNPQRADAIVVLAGETGVRPAKGLEMLRRGFGARLFLDVEAGEVIYDRPLTGIAQQFLSGQPEASLLSVCAINGRSTAAETGDVERCLHGLGAHRLLIVTSDYHTRRALTVFSHRLSQYQWSVAAAHNPAAFGDRWWTQREWAKSTFDEWTKLIWWEAVDRWR